MASKAELVAKRGHAKASITRLKTFMEGPTMQTATVELLESKRDRLKEVFTEYNDYCIKIQLLDTEDKEDSGEIEDTYLELLSKLNAKIDCESSNGKFVSQIKLPHIVIPKFSGRYSEFYEFFNMFESVIGSDKSKPPVQKFYYLKNFLSDEPLALVSNLPLTDSSYKEAIKLLKDRYDNKFQITCEHINTLLDMHSITKSTPANLRAFVSTCKQQLAALKNLGEPVEHWNSIMVCVLSKKLDLISSRAYQLERDSTKNPTVSEFLTFLEHRALALENTDSIGHKPPQRFASNAAVISSGEKGARQETSSCMYCKLNHKLYTCPTFKLAPIEKRLRFVAESKICKQCLNMHAKKCRFHFKCNVCKQAHHTLLHNEPDAAGPIPTVTLLSSASHEQVLLPTARVKIISKSGTIITCRALLDSGSQVSFMTQKLADLVGGTPDIAKSNIVGITNSHHTITHSMNVEIHSLVYPFKTSVKCHVVPQITSQLPQKQFDISQLNIPSNYRLADECFNKPGDVHLLLGAEIFFQILLPQPDTSGGDAAAHDSTQPRLVNTTLGYIVAGRTPSAEETDQVVSLFCKECNSNISESMSRFWTTEQVAEIYPENLPELVYTEKHFQKTVVLDNNQFQVSMPLKVPLEDINNELGDSLHLALCRFINLEKRFAKDEQLFQEYKKFIDQYVELGHGKYIDINQYDLKKDPVYFLPHHPVIKQDSKTTKLRVVFDGSMKTNKKVSLNDMLMKGPVVQKDLLDILIAFRLDKYFFISDIKMMFRFILLDPSQRSLQNILWREQPNEDIKCIQLQTVTYGLKTSSYAATRCLIELAQRFEQELPSAASILKNNTYIDDTLVTNNSEIGLVNDQKQLIHLLSLGGFQLHKWSSNCDDILANVPKDKQYFGDIELQKDDLSVKALGVNFEMRSDTFKLHTTEKYSVTKNTKREILSYISRFFDPLGLMGPIFVQAKLIMQSLWAENIGWDEVPPDSICQQWIEFEKSLANMQPIHVPRCVRSTNDSTNQLIGFADASLIAHGCCLYLRVIDTEGKVSMNLLCSKSRINPQKKKLTIPRLELNAALLLARLADKVLTTLRTKISIERTHLFIDSQITLAWINTDISKLNTYVANRTRVIQELSSQNCYQWGYIDTNDNPADCISRGVLPHDLQSHPLWWNGPVSYHDKNFEFAVAGNESVTIPELKTTVDNDISVPVVCAVTNNENNNCIFNILKQKYSDINKMVRVLSYIIRFCKNSKPNSLKCKETYLCVGELDYALSLLIKSEQQNYYCNEIRSIQSGDQITGSLKQLHPFLDQDNILRVGGRLHHASLPYSKKHPIILPKNSIITVLIIRQEHIRLLHAGQRLVLCKLNQKYWLTDGLRTVKKVIHKCVTCFRLKAAATNQLMGSLPADRVNACRPFEKVGIDFAGPISVKLSRIRRSVEGKGYILVIVCFVTKAIHLELASDLTTDTFLACLKRFIARRNLPSDIYCDNASTFRGARTRLGDLYRLYGGDKDHQVQAQSFASERGIRFHFIPSYSPVFGGLWESSVKSVKYHLKRVMGRALLTYEQLNTVLVEIEAVLNSRPISAMSADPTDFSYLTPGHFLTNAPLNSYPEQDVSNTPTNSLKFWSICTSIKQTFWKQWKNVYLTTLQNRPKWRSLTPNIAVGSLVILRQDNVPPLQWPMARVVKVFPGADGAVRAIEVKTSNGHSHRRSVTKVCVLPIDIT